MIKLSKASKMPCFSWSLLAKTHCPASVHFDGPEKGELVPACDGCYADEGNYRFPNVRAPRISNAEDWKRDDWADEMVDLLAGEDHFRWFDSGDVAWLGLAIKMLDVMRRTPNTSHWLPTRMHKFPKFRPVFARMRKLANVVVRFSSDSIEGAYDARLANTSTIFSCIDQLPVSVTVCEAYTREGKCGPCRACWDPAVRVIAYPGHGARMTRLQNLIATDRAA